MPNFLNKFREKKLHQQERAERIEDIKTELELRGQHIYKKTPEEVELNSYLQEEHRDAIRSLVLRKRKERLNKLLGVSHYGSEDRLPNFKQKPKQLPKPKWL